MGSTSDVDFIENYNDMRDANTIGGDKYFHCKANCESASRGLGGEIESQLLSETRELFDEYIKGDSPAQCNADRQANNHGRQGGSGNSNANCNQVCQPFRPNGLPAQYQRFAMFQNNKLKVIGFLILTLLILSVIVIVIRESNFFSIDKCLDNGGRWDYEKDDCIYK